MVCPEVLLVSYYCHCWIWLYLVTTVQLGVSVTNQTTGSNLHTFPGGVRQFYNSSNWEHDILHSFPREKCKICLRNNKIFMFLCPVILKFCGPSATKIITFLICICGQNGNLTNLQKCKIIGNRAPEPKFQPDSKFCPPTKISPPPKMSPPTQCPSSPSFQT